MDDNRFTRRGLLRTGALATTIGMAGCVTRIVDPGGQDIQDSDGDGVIDSEDYAPRDPEVQREGQVKGEETTSAEPAQDSPTETEPAEDTPRTTPTSETVATSDLLSRWPLRSGFEDEIGGHHGEIVQGNPTFGTFSGRAGVSFEGSDAVRVSRGGHGELSLLCSGCEPSSFSMWVYFDKQAGDGPTWDGASHPSHTLLKNDTGYRLNGVPAEGSGVNLTFSVSNFGDSPASGYGLPDETTITVPTDEWHHFGVTVDPTSSVVLYVDGQERFSDDSMDGYSAPNQDFWSDITIGRAFGGNPEGWVNTLDGKLSDLRIYNPGLSSSQMNQIYANTR